MKRKRQDFLEPVKKLLAERVGYICSNPDCGVATIGPAETYDKKEYVGVAAHIYSASIDNGPRPNPNLTEEERTSIKNGIHLCNKCSRKIDTNNGVDYPAELLNEWKRNAEAKQQSRCYENNFKQLYRQINYQNLESEYSSALTCKGLGEYEVNSCPIDSGLIKQIEKNLNLAKICIIKGPSGSGKSLLTYQAAKLFHDDSIPVFQINKSHLKSIGHFDAPLNEAILVIDDAQTLPENLFETIIHSANSKLMILANWNTSSSQDSSFLESYPNVDIVPKVQVELLKNYCLANKDSLSNTLSTLGIRVNPRFFHDTIEQRIERASFEETPWAFNYSLSEGWATAKMDIEKFHHQNRMDIVIYVIATFQLASLDEGVDVNDIHNSLKKYSTNKEWLKKAEQLISNVADNADGNIRLKHYRYAESILKTFISSFNDDVSRDFSISLLESILQMNEFCKGHANILEFVMFNFYLARHAISQRKLIRELSSDSLLNNDLPIRIKIQRLRSLIRFSENCLYTIEETPGVIENWILNCDKDTAYPLYWLINELGIRKYSNLIITRKILNSIFNRFDNSPLSLKARFSGLFCKVTYYADGSQLPYASQIIDSINPVIDLSKYKSDTAHAQYAHIICDLAAINEKWAKSSLMLNISSIAEQINTNTLKSLENYHELFHKYFGVISAILSIKGNNPHTKVAKKLIAQLYPEAIASTLSSTNHSNIKMYCEFLLFIKLHNKQIIRSIVDNINFDHLKSLYKGDKELDHEHNSILSVLYDRESENFNRYISHLMDSLDIFNCRLLLMNPDLGIEHLKSGKKLNLKISIGDECELYLHILTSLENDNEIELVRSIVFYNKDNIGKAIFSSSTNIDRHKSKFNFLTYAFCKNQKIFQEIFSDDNKNKELLLKIKRLLKGTKMEKQIAKLYLFFIRECSNSFDEDINQLEKRYPSIKRFHINT